MVRLFLSFSTFQTYVHGSAKTYGTILFLFVHHSFVHLNNGQPLPITSFQCQVLTKLKTYDSTVCHSFLVLFFHSLRLSLSFPFVSYILHCKNAWFSRLETGSGKVVFMNQYVVCISVYILMIFSSAFAEV